jgi:hypothetical protein
VSQVIVTERAGRELERYRRFLAPKNQLATRRAGEVIEQQFALLETNPE